MAIQGSFLRLPIAFCFNREIYAQTPRSVQIKEDVALSFASLRSIKSKSFDGAKNTLENIIAVYNDNIAYINHSNQNRTGFQDYTYQEYCQDRGYAPSDNLLYAYNEEEISRQSDFLKKTNEEAQISQLAYLFPDLEEKIAKTIERLKTMSPNGEIPNYTFIPVWKKHPHNLFAPQLRQIATPVEGLQIVQEPQTETSETSEADQLRTIPSEQATSSSVETPKVDQEPQSKVLPETSKTKEEQIDTKQIDSVLNNTTVPLTIDVNVNIQIGKGQTLAVCSAPHWGEKPMTFTKSESGWNGQIPVNSEWKFVILEQGQITQWEKGKNRRCGEQTPAFTVKAHEIKFS